MEIWYAVIGLTLGLLILSFSSEKTVNQLIKLASTMRASTFTVGLARAPHSFLGHRYARAGEQFNLLLSGAWGYLSGGLFWLGHDPDFPDTRVNSLLLQVL